MNVRRGFLVKYISNKTAFDRVIYGKNALS